jgi:hypothetical protein
MRLGQSYPKILELLWSIKVMTSSSEPNLERWVVLLALADYFLIDSKIAGSA